MSNNVTSGSSYGSMNGRHPQPDGRHVLIVSPKQTRHYCTTGTTSASNTDHHDLRSDTESEAERQDACRGMSIIALLLFAILISLRYATKNWFFPTPHIPSSPTIPTTDEACPETIPFCHPPPHTQLQVARHTPGIPSFWNYAPQGPISVTYDGRSLLLNGQRALFLAGSLHPGRATPATWDHALDLAVQQGLNMITIYVFWQQHQPLATSEIDWTLMKTQDNQPWTLADAIRAAARRGLFVHARIGPYVCAEYNFGGIPEWVPLHSPDMAMRRYNQPWMTVMEEYVTATVAYLTDHQLFAHQGGNIVLAQIENELGEDKTEEERQSDQQPMILDNDGTQQRLLETTINHSVQDYADWCGALVQRLAPDVVWTMCYGLAANNTILTCNGDCPKWLEQHGQKQGGNIQVDQPAMWTEDEGGFQIWGDDPKNVSDYFWGRTARNMARDAVKWFARGGTHINYYMWWGGYNRGRASAAGIMNAYATDAPVCTSGQPRYPKYQHFQALHHAIQQIAPILLAAPTALDHGAAVQRWNDFKSEWEWSDPEKQAMYVYRTNHTRADNQEDQEVVFVENNSGASVVVRLTLLSGDTMMTKATTSINSKNETLIIEMDPWSAMIIMDGAVIFDSFQISANAMAYKRKTEPGPVRLLGWASCAEPIGALSSKRIVSTGPVEQTALNMDADFSSDYAWYQTSFHLKESLDEVSILVESQKGSAMVLFLDGVFQGEAYERHHAEGNATFDFFIGSLESGHHDLAILSESLGYNNLIGRWGGGTGAKVKGITGDVTLSSSQNGNQSLIGVNKEWISSPTLNGGEKGFCKDVKNVGASSSSSVRPLWSTAMFNTPEYDPKTQALYVNVTQGRGHLWLNGHDLGRFWNITRGDSIDKYSQQFYFLPYDLLDMNGSVNKLVFFDALGSDLTSTKLVLSWLEETELPNLPDEVAYSEACI
ncbi:Beta-galactosidase [Seminavis robusta]|uniref:beta-galactosidase n=1 Tax=Seminavis robusta TaxID=568900 RepID=A0A9N8HVS6_9STRA|nr:Beta-galactosidase [Seminavis robusta]|eukprot:Sro1997_g310100.1 Beta-galactosidase (943) ;mRNA; r:11474-14423